MMSTALQRMISTALHAFKYVHTRPSYNDSLTPQVWMTVFSNGIPAANINAFKSGLAFG